MSFDIYSILTTGINFTNIVFHLVEEIDKKRRRKREKEREQKEKREKESKRFTIAIRRTNQTSCSQKSLLF